MAAELKWCYVTTRACHGRPWGQRQRIWSGETFSKKMWGQPPRASILFSTESERNRLTKKAWTVWMPVLRLKLKIPCLLRARWKISSCNYRQHPVCRRYKSGNRCSLPMSASWWWEQPQLEVENKVLKDKLLFWKKEKNVQGKCISKFRSNEFCSTESWRMVIAGHTRNSQDAPGTKLSSGKKWAIWRHYPKTANLMSEILARPVLRKKHLGKPHNKLIVTAK